VATDTAFLHLKIPTCSLAYILSSVGCVAKSILS